MLKKSKNQHNGDPKFTCPFCIVMKKNPPFHPLLQGNPDNINQKKSWETHLGICSSRSSAIAKCAASSKARVDEHNRKRLRQEDSKDELQQRRNQYGETLTHCHKALPLMTQVNISTYDAILFNAMTTFVERLDPLTTRFEGVKLPEIPLESAYNDNEDIYMDEQQHSSSSSSSSGGMVQQIGEEEDVVNDDVMFRIGNCLILDGDINIASNVVFEHQQKLEEEYNQMNLYQTLSPKASSGFSSDSKLTISDLIGLADWFEKASITIDNGNALLKVLNKIIKDHGLQEVLHFPTQAETIIHFVSRNFEKLHPVTEFKIQFPEEQWGLYLHDGTSPLPEVKCARFNFLELIAERALIWDPNKVKWCQTEEEKKDKKITQMFTSNLAEHIFKVLDIINERDTNNIVHGKRIVHVPLFLAVTQDDTRLSGNGAEEGCPLLIQPLQFPDEDPFFLGLQPKCPMTKSTLQNIQAKLGCTHKGVQKEQISSLKKYIRDKFVEEAVSEVRAHHKNGILLQIGPDCRHFVIAHPIICTLTGDGVELFKQCGINWQMRGRKCRFCTESNCLRFTKDAQKWNPRDDVRMRFLSTELDRIQKMVHRKLCADRSVHTRKQSWYTQSDLDIIAEAKAYNIMPTSCTVYFDLGFDISKIWGIPKFGLHCMGAVDMLHTFLKGIVENAVCWTMSCLYLLQDINPDAYCNIVSNLDEIFHTFPYKQCVAPVPLFYKEYGISKLISDARSKKQSAVSGTGTGVGGTPASHLPGIAFMLLHAIGREGGAVSAQSKSTIPELVKIDSRKDKNKYGPKREYKIRTIIVNALQSVLNALTFARKTDGFSEKNLDELDYLLKLSRSHLLQLFSLKSDLKQMKMGVPVDARVDKGFGGIKHHLLEHLTFCIRLFGAPNNFDTQNSEHFHVLVKRFYRETSKRKDTCNIEILQHFAKLRRLSFIQRAMDEAIPEDNSIARPQDLQQKYEKRVKSIDDLQIQLEEFKQNILAKCERESKNIISKKVGQQQHLHEVRQQLQQLEQIREQQEIDINLGQIIKYNNILESSGDSLFSTFFIPRNSPKAAIEANGESFYNSAPGKNLLHPFVDWNQLFTYLNLKTPEGLSKEFFLRHKVLPGLYKIKLNAMLSSRGKPELGIDPFTIHCNAQTNNFSSLEVSYINEQKEVVMVFGIVTLHEMGPSNPTNQEVFRTVLVCGRLRKHETSRAMGKRHDSIHCQIVEYDIKRNSNALEVDVIDLTSIIYPACVIPIFTQSFRPNYREKKADLTVDRRNPFFYGNRNFYHVPIPTMHYFKVINYQVIDAAIDIRYRSAYGNGGNHVMPVEETNEEKKNREELERNFIAHHLFLSEEELRWTEKSNNVLEHNEENETTYTQSMWKDIETGDLWREETEIDLLDDDDVLLD